MNIYFLYENAIEQLSGGAKKNIQGEPLLKFYL